jgi:hypothetical protein
MTHIAFILLCHKDPEGIISQALRLTAAGDFISIHFDARAKPTDYARIRAALAGNPAVTFARKRVKCGWGEWSLVAATLEALRAAAEDFPAATHFYMLSGDCMPIKTAEHVHARLEADDVDYIECFDFFESDWIKTGIKEERLIYRHWFNERNRKKLFYASMEWQKTLGLRRKVPAGLRMRIGSQWWCLRRKTVESVLQFIRKRPDVIRFFRTTWIPDESFFQTIVAHLVPAREVRSQTLTFLMFTDYGMPVTFYNDHHDLLIGQDFLFARKISQDALDLRERLGALYVETGRSFEPTGDGQRQFRFLTGRGRVGRRFAHRVWDRETHIGRDRMLVMIACKKWHVARRLTGRLRGVEGWHAVDYLFNEASTALPDLGGIQSTLEKRMRHRRALVRMLYDHWGADRLILCVDPSNVELIRDFYNDRARVRLLEIDCQFSDDYLEGHARRIGLAGANTAPATMAQLLPTLRQDLLHETEQLRDMELSGHYRLREIARPEANAAALAELLDIPVETARDIATDATLFTD